MKSYIMALDQGTTSSRCILFDREGKIRSVARKEFTQIYPHEGWVEHNPAEIWATQFSVAAEAMAAINATASDIAAIGVTNQRETTIVWDKATGEPIYNAIVWQCRRTADYCGTLTEIENELRERTGLRADPYFSASKLAWLLDNVSGACERAERGELLFGTVDTWLIWKLTGGRVHATDVTNASRTMLFNINTLTWDEFLLEKLNIPACMLPEVKQSSDDFGVTALFGGEIPITGVAGDQHAALFGQCCFEAGTGKNTYGTGCFLLMNTGSKPVKSEHGLLTTIAWQLDGEVTYALEGSVFVAGAAIQWLRDELRLIDNAAQSEEMAQSVADTAGCYVVPAFTGLGAPYWNPYARGIICGLSRGVNRRHIVRATLESLAYQTMDVITAMEEDSGIPTKALQVDGGASANDFLMQFQSDMLSVPVRRPACIETTALGAAFLAGLRVGFWQKDELRELNKNAASFLPKMAECERQKRKDGWKSAVALIR